MYKICGNLISAAWVHRPDKTMGLQIPKKSMLPISQVQWRRKYIRPEGARNRREAPKKFLMLPPLQSFSGGADLDTGSIYPSPLYMYWESFIYLGREVWRLGLQSRGCFARAGLVAGSGRPFYHGRPGDNPRKIFHVNQDFKILHFDAVWKENTQKITRSATTYCVLNAYTCTGTITY